MGLIKAIIAPFICRAFGHDWMTSLAQRDTRRCRRCRQRQRMVPPATRVEFILNDEVVAQTTVGHN